MSNLTVNFTEEILDVTVPNDSLNVTVVEEILNVTESADSLDVTIEESALDVTVGSDLEIEITENTLDVTLGEIVEITNNYGSDTVAVTAAENLGGHRIVTVEGYYASKDTATDKNKVLGMTTGAASIGSEATVQVSGFIEESSWNWNVDLPVFLSTDGQLTQSAITSGFSLIVGKPRTATNMFISISEPIILI